MCRVPTAPSSVIPDERSRGGVSETASALPTGIACEGFASGHFAIAMLCCASCLYSQKTAVIPKRNHYQLNCDQKIRRPRRGSVVIRGIFHYQQPRSDSPWFAAHARLGHSAPRVLLFPARVWSQCLPFVCSRRLAP